MLRSVWRRTIPYSLRHAVGGMLHPLAMARTRRRAMRSLGSAGCGPPALVGFFSGSSGIALSVQLASRALEQLGIEHRRIDVGDLAAPNQPGDFSASGWMFHLNAPELLLLLRAWGPERLAGPRFGYWAWELPVAPRAWLRTAEVVDGVIAPSCYTAAALAAAPVDVTVTPHPLLESDFDRIQRDGERPSGEAFRVVAMFDFASSVARKNPFGALEAFTASFGDDESVRLVIKASNAGFAPELRRALQDRARRNVEIVDGVWQRPRVLRFIASADALISLHRAEGFGLPLAEAMMLGVPVVATGWSGNLDFMDADTSCLVQAKLVPIDDPQGIYAGQAWAEPNLHSAAEHLRRLRSDPAFTRALAVRAKARLVRQLGADAWFDSLPRRLQTAFGRFAMPNENICATPD